MHEIRVYTASKLRHAEMFRDLRHKVDGVYFTARWPVTIQLASEAAKSSAQMQQDNFDDISRSHAVIVYVEKGEHLKGGLVEVGYAIAHGKMVYVVGQHEDYSKWQFHPNVRRCGTVEQALADIKVTFKPKVKLVDSHA